MSEIKEFDVVQHRVKGGPIMFVESVDRMVLKEGEEEFAFCFWFDDHGAPQSRAFNPCHLVKVGEVVIED